MHAFERLLVVLVLGGRRDQRALQHTHQHGRARKRWMSTGQNRNGAAPAIIAALPPARPVANARDLRAREAARRLARARPPHWRAPITGVLTHVCLIYLWHK